MSNPILTSNQSSAVVATINESKTYSPWVYNETHRLVSPHAMQVLNISPTSSSVAPGRTVHFDIAKNGLLQGVFLQLNVDYVKQGTETESPAGQNTKMHPEGLLALIDKVRLTTSGRIVEELDKAQILARYSDLPFGHKTAVMGHLRAGSSGASAFGETKPIIYLPFYFSVSPERYALFSNFVEPHTVEVVLTDGNIALEADGANTTIRAQSASLLCHYRQLEEPQINEVVQKNYGSGLHTQIVNISKREAYQDLQATAAANDGVTTLTMTKELKESEAITSMYVYVECLNAGPNAILNQKRPLQLEHVTVKFANTTVIDTPAEFLKIYGRWSMSSDGGDGSVMQPESAEGFSNLEKIAKIDFSLDRADGQVSNVVSLREISNPIIQVQFDPLNLNIASTYRLHVVYNTATFLTTSSATGRVNLSISS